MKIRWNTTELVLTGIVCVLAGGLTWTGLQMASDRPEETRVNEDSTSSTLPACAEEDSTNCFWDAGLEGNGEGVSFVDVNGVAYYPQTDEITLEDMPLDYAVTSYDEGVFVCGVNAGVAIDYDEQGNAWAYCEPALAGSGR